MQHLDVVMSARGNLEVMSPGNLDVMTSARGHPDSSLTSELVMSEPVTSKLVRPKFAVTWKLVHSKWVVTSMKCRPKNLSWLGTNAEKLLDADDVCCLESSSAAETSMKCRPKNLSWLGTNAEKLLDADDVCCLESSSTAETCLDAGAPFQDFLSEVVVLLRRP